MAKFRGGTLTQCVNFGKMSNDWYGTGVVQHTDIRIGGIAGMASVNLSECGNYGEIYSSYQTNSSPYQTIYPKESYAGGIAGYSTGTIKNCFNTGKVYSKADTKTELVEDYQFNVKGEYKNVKTGTCYSASGGSLSSYNASAERVFMGATANSFSSISTEGCTKKTYKVTSGFSYAYGIGYTTSTVTSAIENCYNTGVITGGNTGNTVKCFFNDMHYFYHPTLIAWDESSKVDMSLDFYAGKSDYGYISNTSKVTKCYYLKNSEDDSRYITYNGESTKYYYASSLSKSIELYVDTWLGDSSYTVKVTKSSNNDTVYIEGLIPYSKIFNNSNQCTYNKAALTHYGTGYSSVDTITSQVKTNFPNTIWGINSSINNGQPYIKAIYW